MGNIYYEHCSQDQNNKSNQTITTQIIQQQTVQCGKVPLILKESKSLLHSTECLPTLTVENLKNKHRTKRT